MARIENTVSNSWILPAPNSCQTSAAECSVSQCHDQGLMSPACLVGDTEALGSGRQDFVEVYQICLEHTGCLHSQHTHRTTVLLVSPTLFHQFVHLWRTLGGTLHPLPFLNERYDLRGFHFLREQGTRRVRMPRLTQKQFSTTFTFIAPGRCLSPGS